MHIQTSDQEKLNLGFGNYSCNWGVHMCGLYETVRERDEIIYGFLKQGYLEGDLQLFCPTEQSHEEFRERITDFCPECDVHIHNPDHFQIKPAKELYYPDGIFDPISMEQGLNAFYASTREPKPRNIRATAEMVWALKAIPGIEHLMAYEARLNYFIPGKPWISICMYNVTRFSGSIIMNVLQTHPYTISGGIVTQNPYYIHPDIWLAENAPQFLD